MRFGLLADTHDHLGHVALAVGEFKVRGVTGILHAGDMTGPGVVLAMDGFAVTGVLGNNDHRQHGALLRAFGSIGGDLPGEFAEMSLPGDGGLLAIYHGTERHFLDALITRGGYAVVVCGHTHRIRNERVGGTLVLNPGTAHGYGGRATAMIYDSVQAVAELIELDAGTPG
nr:Phosphodiesterase [uncultured bacterium]